ncbi:MAG: 6-phosphofructokinase [Clostridium sp.]
METLNKLNIECFIYIGGNDSMDTIKKLSDYAILTGQSQKFVGVPKTIDKRDLAHDRPYAPGYGSAAKIHCDLYRKKGSGTALASLIKNSS